MDPAQVTCAWAPITGDGRVPRARYRATCVVHDQAMYLFGGHDGTRHLNDVHVFDFGTRAWAGLQADGPAPIPRDSHVAVTHGNSMFVFGGSTGSAMNDFHELRLDVRKWQPVQAAGYAPGHRFCHVAVVHKDSLYVLRRGNLRLSPKSVRAVAARDYAPSFVRCKKRARPLAGTSSAATTARTASTTSSSSSSDSAARTSPRLPSSATCGSS